MKKKDMSKAAGGKARADSLSPEQRKEIASKAANKKWDNPRAVYGSPENKGTQYLFFLLFAACSLDLQIAAK